MKKPKYKKLKLLDSIKKSKKNIKIFLHGIKEEQKIITELNFYINQHKMYEKWLIKQI